MSRSNDGLCKMCSLDVGLALYLMLLEYHEHE